MRRPLRARKYRIPKRPIWKMGQIDMLMLKPELMLFGCQGLTLNLFEVCHQIIEGIFNKNNLFYFIFLCLIWVSEEAGKSASGLCAYEAHFNGCALKR